MVRLYQVRAARQLSQRDAAILAGISQPHLALVEAGRKRLSPAARERLARGLGLTEQQAQRIAELAP